MTKKIYIFLFPYEFKSNDFYKFELNYFKSDNLEIWNVYNLINKVKLKKKLYYKKNLYYLDSFKDFNKRLKFIQKKYSKIIFLNSVNPNNFYSFLILLKIRKTNYLNFYNSGLPRFNAKNAFQKFYVLNWNNYKLFLFIIIQKIFKIKPRYVFISGYLNKSKFENKSNINIIFGSSWDYSKKFIKKKIDVKIIDTYSVFIDGTVPKFYGDNITIGHKDYLTNDIWYPLLCNFFKNFEYYSKTKIIICGHPKTQWIKNPKEFEYREVFYNKTEELIKNSKYVFSRGSTALSYCAIYNIPSFIIYSDQVLKSKNTINEMNNISAEYGISMFNINNKLNRENFSSLVKDNLESYKKYINKYLTSDLVSLPNYKLIEKI